MKTCGKCRTKKPVSEFGMKSDTRDGLNGYCRICMRGVIRASAARRRDKEAMAEARRVAELRARPADTYQAQIELQRLWPAMQNNH